MANKLIKTLYLNKFITFQDTLKVKAIFIYAFNNY